MTHDLTDKASDPADLLLDAALAQALKPPPLSRDFDARLVAALAKESAIKRDGVTPKVAGLATKSAPRGRHGALSGGASSRIKKKRAFNRVLAAFASYGLRLISLFVTFFYFLHSGSSLAMGFVMALTASVSVVLVSLFMATSLARIRFGMILCVALSVCVSGLATKHLVTADYKAERAAHIDRMLEWESRLQVEQLGKAEKAARIDWMLEWESQLQVEQPGPSSQELDRTLLQMAIEADARRTRIYSTPYRLDEILTGHRRVLAILLFIYLGVIQMIPVVRRPLLLPAGYDSQPYRTYGRPAAHAWPAKLPPNWL